VARRRARELAFRALFQSARGDEPLLKVWRDLRDDLTEQTPDEVEEAYGDPLDAEGIAFAERLVETFAAHQDELDATLEAALEGWTFAQMSQTDLAVLRLALTELSYEKLPPEVTFEVAVRIAKRYGGEESGRFVNGVLARLHRDRTQREPSVAEG
jgi:N utilization substance protein B